PRIENTQQEQLQDAINKLIALWNQDSLLVEGLLTLAENSITLPQLPNEGLLVPVEDNAIPLLLPVEESLAVYDDISLFENTETLAPVTENPNQIDHLEDSEKDCVRQIRNDLLVRSNNTPFRQNLLTTQGWKNQANEIATLLHHERCKREKQVRTLETCYYLGRLQQEYVRDAKTQNEIRKLIRTVLEPRRTASAWKTVQ
ncbi:19111_t:CDS:1, partial [Gigaspora margarita]